MKSIYILILFICLLLIISFKDKEDLVPESLDKIITFSVLNNYEPIEEIYFDENTKKILIEESYGSKKDDGRFTVSMFSYKNKDVVAGLDVDIDENEYIKHMTHKKKLDIKGYTFTLGYNGMDDMQDVIARAYVRYKDYVFQISMSNGDDFVTEKQYNDFIKMLKTIKFKK